jgi:1-acyl-sn-glycerol-3-phosphate acyltransferase
MSNRLVPERSRDLIYIMDAILGTWLENRNSIHVEMPRETQELIRKKTNITYIGLHKSPWETMAIPHVIKSRGGQVPYIVMKDDAIDGLKPALRKIVMYLLEKTGVFTIDREGKKESAFKLLDQIADVLGHKNSLMIFPEGKITWSGEPEKFKTTVFQGVVQAAKKEPQYVVSVDVSYSRVIDAEDHKYPKDAIPKRPIMNKLRWLGSLRDVYISFGKPVIVDDKLDRRALTEKMWEDALDLVKIQPVNITATVIDDYLRNNGHMTKDIEIVGEEIYKGIEALVEKLEPHRGKFRNIGWDNDGVRIAQNSRLPFSLSKKHLYSLYAGYIKPYTSKTASQ